MITVVSWIGYMVNLIKTLRQKNMNVIYLTFITHDIWFYFVIIFDLISTIQQVFCCPSKFICIVIHKLH